MVYLAAAVVLVGVLGLVNLVLSFGVIRRLRRHTELLSRQAAASTGPGPLMVSSGAVLPAFTATATDGGAVALNSFDARTLAGFFAPGCPACDERLPSFLEYAAAVADPARVLAVIVGKAADAEPLRRELSGVARVVLEEHGDALTTAFAVEGFPAFILFDPGGSVVASGLSMNELPVHAAA